MIHITADKLVGLPGMPELKADKTEDKIRNIRLFLTNTNVPYIHLPGKGKPKAYEISRLPAATRNHLSQQLIKSLPATLEAPAARPETAVAVIDNKPAATAAQLKNWQRDCMDARMGFIRLIEKALLFGKKMEELLDELSSASAGRVPELAGLASRANKRPRDGGISKPTLYRWWNAWNSSGHNPVSLAPVDTSLDPDTGTKKRPVWGAALEACWRQPQDTRMTDVLEMLASAIPAGIPMPSYDQAWRYVRSLGAIEREKGRKTGLALSNLRPHRRRDTSHMYPGDAYTADGHCFDAEVAHPYTGRPFRPEITPILDIATRKAIGWSCDLSESGLAVLDALRMACETYGPCLIFYTDNGKGYKNQMMTAEGTGILTRLDIEPRYSRPRNPKAHGISERAHQTILIRAARQLCTFIGSGMDSDIKQLVYKQTRKALRDPAAKAASLLIEWDNFQNGVNAAMERYNSQPHTSLSAVRCPDTRKLIHQSPNQAWDAGIEAMKRDLPKAQWLEPANELPDLYHPMVERTVHNGEISLGKKHNGLRKRYFSQDLEEYHRQRVYVAFSPSDPSRVWVRTIENGELICVAKLDGNLDPYFTRSHLEERREARGEAKIARLERKISDARLEIPVNCITVEHTPEIKAMRDAMIAEVAEISRPAGSFSGPTDPRQALSVWRELNDRKTAGEALSPEERNWWTSWQNSATYKAWALLQQEESK